MDHLAVMTTWAMRRGLPVPSITVTDYSVSVSFLGKDYLEEGTTTEAIQRACSFAYQQSGVFGKVTQIGFLLNPLHDIVAIMDAETFGSPNRVWSLTDYAGYHVAVFAGPADMPVRTDEAPYTVYTTVHPGKECYAQRIAWYIYDHIEVWKEHKTRVDLYLPEDVGGWIGTLLEGEGVEHTLYF
jgi:hypothetical protein